ncbi:MAG: glycine cleavage system protein GcvH [Erysipelothrix sp.]|nr:glycine cleavage system protein GcvH [Erysipelothrix sp.]
MEKILYSKTHEWIKWEGEEITIGISDFAQSELGDVVFVNLPEVNDTLTVGESFADVESVKAVSDIISPIDGEVLEINEDLLDQPELINQDAQNSWFIKVTNVTNQDDLLTYDEYLQFIEEGS